MPPLLPSPDLPEAVRLQIRATEHSSLLATRNITYTAVFGRASILFTVVSAAVVAMALVAQATDFGDAFYVFALLVLPLLEPPQPGSSCKEPSPPSTRPVRAIPT